MSGYKYDLNGFVYINYQLAEKSVFRAFETIVTKMTVQNSITRGQPWAFRSLISEECHNNAASFITRCSNIKSKDNVILENKIMVEEVL